MKARVIVCKPNRPENLTPPCFVPDFRDYDVYADDVMTMDARYGRKWPLFGHIERLIVRFHGIMP